MHVISKARLKAFWEGRKGDAAVAERDLSVWYKLAKASSWENFAAVKQTFPSVDQVGNCLVFDPGNNRFRLIGRANYQGGRLYVLKVMDHKEYDKNLWAESCGCHRPPPRPAPQARPSPSRKRPSSRNKRRRGT